MFDINKESTDLLNDSKVREYLSFVVPVPYKNTLYTVLSLVPLPLYSDGLFFFGR